MFFKIFAVLASIVFAGLAYIAYKLIRWASPSIPPLPQPIHTGKPKSYSLDNPEVVIIGAGVVGATMAVQFGRQGRYAVVIERNMEAPDRIVAEFLQPGGYNKMIQLGIAECTEGIDCVPTSGYVIFRTKDTIVDLPFPKMPNQENRYSGRAFHNAPLLMNLRALAATFPTIKFIEGNVTRLIENESQVFGVKYTLSSDDSQLHDLRAPLTFIADGCFSKFRSQTSVEGHPKTTSSNFVGVLVKDLTLPYEGRGHVMLTEPTPMLFYRISPSDVRALIDIPLTNTLPNKEYIKTITIPQLPDTLATALSKSIEVPDNIRAMPNFKLHPAPKIRPGVLALGDAFNIRHPLTGGGMTVAFSDMSRLVPLLAEIEDFANTTEVMTAYKYFFAVRKPLASTINILAQALYRVFGQCADDPQVSAAIRSACFGYFQFGGECVNGPISLLSGIIESPWVLLWHYYRVGLYAAYLFLFNPIVAVQVLVAVTKVFTPLMSAELGAEVNE